MAREKATKKQQELLQYISDFLKDHDYAPSYREIMAALGYKSVSTVAVHVDGLITKGYLTKSDKSARSVRIASERTSEQDAYLVWLKSEVAKREAMGLDDEAKVLNQALEILQK